MFKVSINAFTNLKLVKKGAGLRPEITCLESLCMYELGRMKYFHLTNQSDVGF